MSDWPKYESHKIVQAMPITGVSSLSGYVLVGPENEPFHPTEPAMAARAEVGGYAVIYEDGYKSISPKKAFEDGYKLIP
jgi:hypothetical protein